MNNPYKESTQRHLRKQHKDWSDAQIEVETDRIWDQYHKENKDRLDQLKKENKAAFDKSVDMELLNLLMDKTDDME